MKFIILCGSILLILSWNNVKKKSYKITSVPLAKKAQEHPGRKLMKVHCYICHDVTTDEDKRLAPPMVAIKRQYTISTDSKKKFIEDIQISLKFQQKKTLSCMEQFSGLELCLK